MGLPEQANRYAPTQKVLEADHYEKFKTIIEVCKISGINFALLCMANVDMANKMLNDTVKVTTTVMYKYGTYFQLSTDERKLVDDQAKEICLATRFCPYHPTNSIAKASKNRKMT